MLKAETWWKRVLYVVVAFALVLNALPPAAVWAGAGQDIGPAETATAAQAVAERVYPSPAEPAEPLYGPFAPEATPAADAYRVMLPVVMQGYTPPASTEAVVEPGVGGRLISGDGDVTLTFAPQAVSETTRIIYREPATLPALPPDLVDVGVSFSLSAYRTADGQAVREFPPLVVTATRMIRPGWQVTEYLVTETVSVTVQYRDSDVAGLDERRLRLHYYDEAENRWIPLLTVVDPQANSASAPLDHFSTFALLGVAAVPSETLVILDPDHGGADPGGTVTSPASYAIEEKAVNLNAALAVRDWLEGCGVNVLMTREDDSSLSAAWRADFINSNAPDLAATVAFNILNHEMSDFIGGPLGLADFSKPDDEDLARQLVRSIAEVTDLPPDRDVHDARTWGGTGLYLPTHVSDTLYAQIESAFLDSYYDRDNVIDPRLEYIAGGIYNGIIARLQLTTCVPFSGTITDTRADRTLGINHWTRYTAQGVNPVTGNQFQWSRDLFVPGPGLNVDIVRYYNSQSDEIGLFGKGWSSLYDMKLDFLDGGIVRVKYADGHRARFTPDGSGYRAEPGVFETLTAEGSGYVLTTPDQLRFTFDGAGVLQSIADEAGNTITLHYTGALLDRIEDAAGRTFDVETDAAGHVTRITDPAGRVVTYTYGVQSLAYTRYLRNLRGTLAPEQAHDLLAMTDANGGQTNYEYDPAGGYLQRITDPEGITYLENVYTPDGKVQEQKNAKGDRGTWDYDLPNMQATFTDNEGNQTVYKFDSKYRVIEEIDALGQSTFYEYDDNDNIIAKTDKRGNTWRYTYDERGNMLTRTDPLDAWSLYDSDVTTWTYDDKNNPTSMTDALGNTWIYEYDDKGNPIHVVEPNGAETFAEYDDKGQMTRLVDAEGRETRFEYDAYGNRIKTWDAEGGWTESTYDASGHELTRTECLNPPVCDRTRTTTYEYDGNGNIIKETDPLGRETTYEYDGNNLLRKKTDRRGGVWEYRYDENLNLVWEKDPLGRINEYTYDKMDHRLTAKDPLGRITSFEYDDIYRLIKVTNPKGDEYHYEYDPNGNLLTLTDPLGYRTRFVYDATNRRKYVHDAIGGTTEYCYDPLDRIIRVFDPRRAKTDFRYDSVGNMVEVIDPLANRVTMGYDRVHNRIRLTEGIPSDGSEPGRTTTYEFDGLNRVVRSVDPLGRVTLTEYDGVGNAIAVTDPMGNITRFEYNLNGWLIREVDPLGGETVYEYDAEGAMTGMTDANGHTTRYDYDLAGQLVKVTDPLGAETRFEYDAAGNQTKIINALGRTTEYAYDELNLLVEERDPLGNVTRYEYDALRRLTDRIDANGLTTHYDYNPLGWLTGVLDAEGNYTRYEYDPVGNRTAIIDANGITTTFEYNFLNQLTRETDPLGKTWEYAYDASGNMIRRVDGKWQATYYRYDAANQLVATVYGIGAGQNISVTFEYDLNGNEIAMHDWNGDWTYEYDALNRRTRAVDYKGRVLEWDYDAVGNRSGMTYPDGRAIGMTYDAADRLDVLTDAQGRAHHWDYDPLGYITAQVNPNNTRTDYDYDAASRLTGLRNTGPGGAIIAAYAYTLDAVGNRTRAVEQRGGATVVRDYEYDDLYRLTRARTDSGQDMVYVYDPVGNRLRKAGTPEPIGGTMPDPVDVSYTYNALNSMLTAGPTRFEYDDNGNRIRKTEPLTATEYVSLALSLGWEITGTVTTDYVYDYENRLTHVTTAISYTQAVSHGGGISYTQGVSLALEARYVYDGYGRRVEKWVTTTLTATGVLSAPTAFHREYVFDGLDPVVEYDYASGPITPTLVSHYTYGNGRMVLLERTPISGTVESYWYHYDGLGSVVALTDESGAEVCRYKYDEYGNLLQDCPDLNHYTYTGQEYDAETGLVHFYARYYDAEVGVWIALDTYRGSVKNPPSSHRYMYAFDNPLTWIDPNGSEPNKAQIGNVEYWYQWLRTEEDKIGKDATPQQRRQLLKTLADQTMGGNPYGVQVDKDHGYDNRKTLFGRYLYSENYGGVDAKSHYLDSLHFFNAAYLTAGGTDPAGAPSWVPEKLQKLGWSMWSSDIRRKGVLAFGLGAEVWQYRQHNQSAFTLEDFPSNVAGADFGRVIDLNRSISDQLKAFLENDAGAYTGPMWCSKEMPAGFEDLPDRDNRTFAEAKVEIRSVVVDAYVSGRLGIERDTSFWEDPLGTVAYLAGSLVRKLDFWFPRRSVGMPATGNQAW